MKVTIKDVAKKAGVSASTVSRALRNNNRISPEVRARVQQVARELNFHPNQMARSLVKRHTPIIGVVFPNDLRMNLGNPFYPSVLQGLGHAASERRHHVLLITGSETLSPSESSRQAVESGYVSGLIRLTAENAATGENEAPEVVIGHPADAQNRYYVDNANAQAGYEAARHLLEHGHRRIVLAGYDPQYIFTVDRREGYERALREAGIAVREAYILSCGPLQKDEGTLRELFQSPGRPTGVVCMDDAQAIALCRGLDALGLRVPRDVSVVSFNNTEASRYHNPPLTTFDLQPYQLGVRAMNLMLDRLTGAVTEPTSIYVPFTLIQRQSVADCPEGD